MSATNTHKARCGWIQTKTSVKREKTDCNLVMELPAFLDAQHSHSTSAIEVYSHIAWQIVLINTI
ncbi:hypothetical protein [Marinobacterium mangrovicola]|uniref:Uncharacterized protein n=1 Tax=Marinobacterium mangrovicola TaxID=1476959 RepID=A0A4R1H8K5_9GAMM|nr:hypothetical protein [Marinobacterium mangrovicola]TCK16415.1 hypothetical protein CLV83_0123 [Marinobacterium mangrovicola]